MKYIFYISIACLLFSCQGKEPEVQEYSQDVSYLNEVDTSNNYGDRILYNGNFIMLEEEQAKGGNYTIQRIENSKGDIQYAAEQIPLELYFSSKGLSEEKVSEAMKDTEGEKIYFFEFEDQQKIDLVHKHFSETLDESISYMAFNISNDFCLISELGDTILAEYSLYERDYQIAPYERLIVGFANTNPSESYQLIYKDVLFGRGEMSFNFAPESQSKTLTNNPS